MVPELYRGKSKDTGKWIIGKISLSQDDPEVYIVRPAGVFGRDWWTVIPTTIGLSSNCKDATGTDIFTDDLVRDTCTGAEGIVKFGRYRNPTDTGYTEHIGFFIQWDNLNLKRDIGFWENNGSIIVTGNIHETEGKIKKFGGLRDV